MRESELKDHDVASTLSEWPTTRPEPVRATSANRMFFCSAWVTSSCPLSTLQARPCQWDISPLLRRAGGLPGATPRLRLDLP